MDAVIVHFHEITLKGRNRPIFERRLLKNIYLAAEARGSAIKKTSNIGGGFLIFPEEKSKENFKDCLSKIFGIANIMPVYEFSKFESARLNPIVDKCTDLNLEELGRRVVEELKNLNFPAKGGSASGGKTFRITSSTEINKKLGEFVKNSTGKKVNLENPELTIFVEFIKGKFYFGFEKIKGVGGLPVGASGKAVSLLSGGIDSPVASFMMMKRGLELVFVHFHGHPYTSAASREKAEELAAVLNQYHQKSRLYLVPFGEIQKKVVLSVPSGYRIIIYRRLMLRIAEEIAKKEKAKALVTGENLGQVSSQTLENISVIAGAVSLPVLRPLVGFDKEEIINKAKEINTYEISIRPDEDCCTLFTPKHPVTKSRLENILKIEKNLPVDEFISGAINSSVLLRF